MNTPSTFRKFTAMALAVTLFLGLIPANTAHAETAGACGHPIAGHQLGCCYAPAVTECAVCQPDESGAVTHGGEGCAMAAEVPCTCKCADCLTLESLPVCTRQEECTANGGVHVADCDLYVEPAKSDAVVAAENLIAPLPGLWAAVVDSLDEDDIPDETTYNTFKSQAVSAKAAYDALSDADKAQVSEAAYANLVQYYSYLQDTSASIVHCDLVELGGPLGSDDAELASEAYLEDNHTEALALNGTSLCVEGHILDAVITGGGNLGSCKTGAVIRFKEGSVGTYNIRNGMGSSTEGYITLYVDDSDVTFNQVNGNTVYYLITVPEGVTLTASSGDLTTYGGSSYATAGTVIAASDGSTFTMGAEPYTLQPPASHDGNHGDAEGTWQEAVLDSAGYVGQIGAGQHFYLTSDAKYGFGSSNRGTLCLAGHNLTISDVPISGAFVNCSDTDAEMKKIYEGWELPVAIEEGGSASFTNISFPKGMTLGNPSAATVTLNNCTVSETLDGLGTLTLKGQVDIASLEMDPVTLDITNLTGGEVVIPEMYKENITIAGTLSGDNVKFLKKTKGGDSYTLADFGIYTLTVSAADNVTLSVNGSPLTGVTANGAVTYTVSDGTTVTITPPTGKVIGSCEVTVSGTAVSVTPDSVTGSVTYTVTNDASFTFTMSDGPHGAIHGDADITWTPINQDSVSTIVSNGSTLADMGGAHYYLTGDVEIRDSLSANMTLCLNGHELTIIGMNKRLNGITICSCEAGGTVFGSFDMNDSSTLGIVVVSGAEIENITWDIVAQTHPNNANTLFKNVTFKKSFAYGDGSLTLSGSIQATGTDEMDVTSGKGMIDVSNSATSAPVIVLNGLDNSSVINLSYKAMTQSAKLFGTTDPADLGCVNPIFPDSMGSWRKAWRDDGIYLDLQRTLTLEDDMTASVEDAVTPGEYYNGDTVTVTNLPANATGLKFTDASGQTVNLTAAPTGDGGGYAFTMPDYNLTVTADTTPTHTDHGNTGKAWTAITSLDDITGSGNYYLTADDLNRTTLWTVPSGGVNLCLNGHTVSRSSGAGAKGSIIDVGSHTLHLYDCPGEDGTEGKITGAQGTAGGAILVEMGYLGIHGGSITGNSSSGYGGGIALTSSGTVEITGGSITNNKSNGSHGGGIYVTGTNATLNISGGTISGNTSAFRGGGIYVSGASAAVTISKDAKVSGNSAANGKDIMVVEDSSLNISGGAVGNVHIDKGTADYTAGTVTAIHVGTGGTVTGQATAANVCYQIVNKTGLAYDTDFTLTGAQKCNGEYYAASGAEVTISPAADTDKYVYSHFTSGSAALPDDVQEISGGVFTAESGTHTYLHRVILESLVTYYITIPEKVTIGSSGTQSINFAVMGTDNNEYVPDSLKFKVQVTGTHATTNTGSGTSYFAMKHSDMEDYQAYTITAAGYTFNQEIPFGSAVEINGILRDFSFGSSWVFKLDDTVKAKYAGTYTDTLTFDVELLEWGAMG